MTRPSDDWCMPWPFGWLCELDNKDSRDWRHTDEVLLHELDRRDWVCHTHDWVREYLCYANVPFRGRWFWKKEIR